MEMKVRQQASQPLQIWLRGEIDETDVNILWRESQMMINQACQAVWIYLEHIQFLSERVLHFFQKIAQYFQQQEIPFMCIVHQQQLQEYLQKANIPVHVHPPDLKLEKPLLF